MNLKRAGSRLIPEDFLKGHLAVGGRHFKVL